MQAKQYRRAGAVHIIGHILDDSRVSPREMVTMNPYFLNTYDQGQAYTEGEYTKWIEKADLERVEHKLLPNGMSIMTARKPG